EPTHLCGTSPRYSPGGNYEAALSSPLRSASCPSPFIPISHGTPAKGALEEMSLRMQARVPVSSMRSDIFLAGPDGPGRQSAGAPTAAGGKRNPGRHHPPSFSVGTVAVFAGSGRLPSADTRPCRTRASAHPSAANPETGSRCRPLDLQTPREGLRTPAADAPRNPLTRVSD